MLLFVLGIILCCVLVSKSKKNNAERGLINTESDNALKDAKIKDLELLNKMKDLLDKGAITQEEFDNFKVRNGFGL